MNGAESGSIKGRRDRTRTEAQLARFGAEHEYVRLLVSPLAFLFAPRYEVQTRYPVKSRLMEMPVSPQGHGRPGRGIPVLVDGVLKRQLERKSPH